MITNGFYSINDYGWGTCNRKCNSWEKLIIFLRGGPLFIGRGSLTLLIIYSCFH